MNPTAPVSAALEADLLTWVGNKGVLVWLDLDDHYSAFVHTLAARRAAGDLPFAIHAFRGSHLALMLELEGLAGGLEKPPLVIHLPGFNEDDVRQTPLLELYMAGARYRKALGTLITEAATGKVRPEQIEAFLARGAPTLASADAWLAELLAEHRVELAVQLRDMRPEAVLDDLLRGGFVAGQVRDPAALEALWAQIAAWLGLPDTWRQEVSPRTPPGAGDVALVAASWALAAEYVDDLAREPVEPRLQAAKSLPKPLAQACRTLAAHLRDRHPDFYLRTADETESWLGQEIDQAHAAELGQIDTFRFEEERILLDALDALDDERWDDALSWASTRIDGRSFWLRHDLNRMNAWQLVRDAARLGVALTAAGAKLDAASLELALDRYLAAGAPVDRSHRQLEQRRAAQLVPDLPEFEVLRARLDALRGTWRAWADLWARDFNQLCRKQGFLPPAELQQRTLFDDVVRPWTKEPGTTAFFVVDALRYEMATALFTAFESASGTNAQLRARYAELPTVTEVGMNVLAPVADRGRLRPATGDKRILGFSTGEFRVFDRDTRQRAMAHRAGGATCPWLSLADVLTRDATSLKQAVSRARLVVVHSQEIDKAGEAGVGLLSFEKALQDLLAAWRLLRDAGVSRFVITADHGFLLLDELGPQAQAHGRKIDPSRRHVLSTLTAELPGEVNVSLASLNYLDADEQLILPETVAVFDTGRRAGGFVHGGNSLQERVIPVLTVAHHRAPGADTSRYEVIAEPRDPVLGVHCLWAHLEMVSQRALAFGGARVVNLALRAVDHPQVQVKLREVRGSATLDGSLIQARVGDPFELFFELSGPIEARVQVELHHPSAVAEVTPCQVGRFAVSVVGGSATRSEPPAAAPADTDRAWLGELPEGGVRELFAHLAAHGVVTELEAARMLGSPRALRSFSRDFERYAAKAPFEVRIDAVAHVKRYVREGGSR